MSDFQPSTLACRTKRCPHLVNKKIDTVAGDRYIRVCEITGKIPGNMAAVKECGI